MTKKHYLSLVVCGLLIVISLVCYGVYYRDYIAPESYVVGTIDNFDYKELAIKDYVSDDEVIFSQNINDVTFVNNDGIAVYEYVFDAYDFNGELSDYIVYVNNNMISDIRQEVGTVGGFYELTYFDVNKNVLASSSINIDFSFYSLKSKLKVSLEYEDLGYLLNYFKSDNFIITLAESPFTMNSKDVEIDYALVDESSPIEVSIIAGADVTVTYDSNTTVYETENMGVYMERVVATIDAKASDEIRVGGCYSRYFYVKTDGEYTIETEEDFSSRLIKWQNATYVTIEFTNTEYLTQ